MNVLWCEEHASPLLPDSQFGLCQLAAWDTSEDTDCHMVEMELVPVGPRDPAEWLRSLGR